VPAATGVQADFNNDGAADLAVGVPGEDVGSISDAGAVNVLYGSASGLLDGRRWRDPREPDSTTGRSLRIGSSGAARAASGTVDQKPELVAA
jgi:FG-GAP repeat